MKKRNHILQLIRSMIIAVLVGSLAAGCTKSDDDEIFGLDPLVFFLLSSASSGSLLNSSLNVNLSSQAAVFSASNSNAFLDSSVERATTANSFYSVSNSGELTLLQIFENTTVSQTYIAGGAYHTTNYVLFSYQGSPCAIVVARKSDSRLFCVPSSSFWPQPETGSLSFLPGVQSDNSENFYVKATYREGGFSSTFGGFAVLKVDPSDIENPAITDFSLSQSLNQTVNHFAVEPTTGDVMYSTGSLSSSTSITTIRQTAGSLQNISANQDRAFVAADGKLNRLDILGSQVVPYTKSGGTYTADTAIPLENPGGAANHFCNTSGHSFLAVNNGGATAGNLYQVYPGSTTASVNTKAITGASKVIAIACDSTYVYVLAQNASVEYFIVRYTPADSSQLTLLNTTENLTISKIGAGNNKVTFSGVRNSDGAKVVGDVANTGGAVNYTSTSAPDVLQITVITN